MMGIREPRGKVVDSAGPEKSSVDQEGRDGSVMFDIPNKSFQKSNSFPL